MLASGSGNTFVMSALNLGLSTAAGQFDPSPLPGRRIWWQDWERFVAGFRLLLDEVHQGDTVAYKQLHDGVLWGPGNTTIAVTPSLKTVQLASKQVDTATLLGAAQLSAVPCDHGDVDPSKGDDFIVNAAHASAGDGFCVVRREGAPAFLEIQQYKLKTVKGALVPATVAQERRKAVHPDEKSAFFILFSTYEKFVGQADKLPQQTGIVSKQNFEDYFGPFASRAIFSSTPVSIASVTRSMLLLTRGIGEARANAILEERNKRAFDGIDDCHKRTNVPLAVLKAFDWDLPLE